MIIYKVQSSALVHWKQVVAEFGNTEYGNVITRGTILCYDSDNGLVSHDFSVDLTCPCSGTWWRNFKWYNYSQCHSTEVMCTCIRLIVSLDDKCQLPLATRERQYFSSMLWLSEKSITRFYTNVKSLSEETLLCTIQVFEI